MRTNVCLFTLCPFPPLVMRLLLVTSVILCFALGIEAFQTGKPKKYISAKSKNFPDENHFDIQRQETLLKTANSIGTISFSSPTNGSFFLYHAPIPFTFDTSDGNWSIVEVLVTCGPFTQSARGNSSGTVYVTAPYSTGSCLANITSSPGYNAINYVQLYTNVSFCLSQNQTINSEFNETNPLSVTFQFIGTAPIQTLSITEFTGCVNPLYSMAATVSAPSRSISSQFYQSGCTSSNGTNDFNMAFAFSTYQSLQDCSNYNNQKNNSLPNYFLPYEDFSHFQGFQITGDYVVEVTANGSLIGNGNISAIGLELCYMTNYLEIASSIYVVPGFSFSYILSLANQPAFDTLVNATLTCDTDSVSDSFLVSQSDTNVHTLPVPADATGICNLYAYSLTDSDYIAPVLKFLNVTNDTIIYIADPTSGSSLQAGQSIRVTLDTSKPITNATGNVNINCTVGSASVSGDVPGVLTISRLNTLYGSCILSLAPSADYYTGEDVVVTINRKAQILSPQIGANIVAGQPFAVLITALNYTANDDAVLLVICGNTPFEYFGKVGQTFYPTMNINAGGQCRLTATIIGSYYESSRTRNVTVISPLVFTQGLPNPSVAGQTYQVQVNAADGVRNVNVDLQLTCLFGDEASGQTVTGSAVNFYIPENMNGFGCTFYAQTTDSLYTNTSQILDVSMSPSTQDQKASLLGASNFIYRKLCEIGKKCDDQRFQNKRIRKKV